MAITEKPNSTKTPKGEQTKSQILNAALDLLAQRGYEPWADDALVFETDEVRIVGEVVHPITHTLIARTQLPLERIERVLSHPQASAQCARFLRERLSDAEVMGAQSTADAVRIVAELTQRDYESARGFLDASGWNLRAALQKP